MTPFVSAHIREGDEIKVGSHVGLAHVGFTKVSLGDGLSIYFWSPAKLQELADQLNEHIRTRMETV